MIFEHHLRMVRTTAFLMVKFLELSQVKALDYRIDYAHRIVFSDILVGIHCQKQSFVTAGYKKEAAPILAQPLCDFLGIREF